MVFDEFEHDEPSARSFLIKSALMLVSRDLILSRMFWGMFLASCEQGQFLEVRKEGERRNTESEC